jgi:hypothetical protein
MCCVVSRKKAVLCSKQGGSCVVWQGGRDLCCTLRKEAVLVGKEEGRCVVW